ncbi:MAG: GIY-YIG nuclease family protein [Clostridiaceae bacterium]|nr:GIY-YIG nuclease family protein [Clostridiaceae bacterium]
MDNKKILKNLYKDRVVTGGIFCIKCQASGRTWVKSTRDLNGQLSRFQFAISTNFCPEPGMREEWAKYGAESFSFTVLDEIEKGKTQTDKEFADDVDALLEIWREKQPTDGGI